MPLTPVARDQVTPPSVLTPIVPVRRGFVAPPATHCVVVRQDTVDQMSLRSVTCWVHEDPPSVERTISPASPTATHTSAVGQLTAFRGSVTPVLCGRHVQETSDGSLGSTVRTPVYMYWSPTPAVPELATQKRSLGQLTPVSLGPPATEAIHQFCAPSSVVKTLLDPTATQ